MQVFDAALAAFAPDLPLGIGLSGGADSTALLVACARRWPGQVVALHVNHQLQAAASIFQAQCQTLCAQLGVELRLGLVDARHKLGQSPEDAARIARYRTLAQLAEQTQGVGVLSQIALAQHADDQVETLLLALSRGAGLAGLSAMAQHWQRGGIHWHRPLLAVSAAEIRAWLQGEGIAFVEDPSNADAAYTRNRMRIHLMPALQAALPQFRQTFARSAAHAAQAQTLLDEVAAQDMATLLHPEHGLPRIKQLQALSHARRVNALRYWLKTSYQTIPSSAQMDELVRQTLACVTRGHHIRIKVGRGVVVRQGDVLAWYNH